MPEVPLPPPSPLSRPSALPHPHCPPPNAHGASAPRRVTAPGPDGDALQAPAPLNVRHLTGPREPRAVLPPLPAPPPAPPPRPRVPRRGSSHSPDPNVQRREKERKRSEITSLLSPPFRRLDVSFERNGAIIYFKIWERSRMKGNRCFSRRDTSTVRGAGAGGATGPAPDQVGGAEPQPPGGSPLGRAPLPSVCAPRWRSFHPAVFFIFGFNLSASSSFLLPRRSPPPGCSRTPRAAPTPAPRSASAALPASRGRRLLPAPAPPAPGSSARSLCPPPPTSPSSLTSPIPVLPGRSPPVPARSTRSRKSGGEERKKQLKGGVS